MIRDMATKQTNDPVIAHHHPLTAAELRQARLAISERKRSLQNEGATNYASQKSGSPPSRPLTDHERRVTAHIQLLLNGSTPPHLLIPVVSRDEQIRAEIDAIDFLDRDLGRQQELAADREAEQWVVQNATQWRALCREIMLAGERLAALEESARQFLMPIESCHGVKIAMGSTIGSGLSLLGTGDPLMDLRAAALKEKIVTESEIRKAQNVE
jgi:hypothetical protein